MHHLIRDTNLGCGVHPDPRSASARAVDMVRLMLEPINSLALVRGLCREVADEFFRDRNRGFSG